MRDNDAGGQSIFAFSVGIHRQRANLLANQEPPRVQAPSPPRFTSLVELYKNPGHPSAAARYPLCRTWPSGILVPKVHTSALINNYNSASS